MLHATSDKACSIPFYEVSPTEGHSLLCATFPCYENENGEICNPGLTPTRGCIPPFLSTSDPNVFTDYKGTCNPDFSPDSYFTVAPTPGKKPTTIIPGISNTTLMIGAAALLLVLTMAGGRRK